MMKVTGIEEISKSRSRVFIDEEFAFVLYKGELRLYCICQGQEIREEDYDVILNEVLPRRAKLRAMNLLKNRDYTERQLRDRLKEGGYPEGVIETAVDYVAGFHYIDDARFAGQYISCYGNVRSRRRIEQDLLGKGIDRQTLEAAWADWEARGGCQDEQAMIEALLEKRKYDPENTDRKEQQRLYGFLLRKGFSGEQIRRSLGLSFNS